MNTLVEGLCWYRRVEATIVQCHVLVRLERVHLVNNYYVTFTIVKIATIITTCIKITRISIVITLYFNALHKPLSPRTRLRVEKQGEGKEDLIVV